MAGFVSQHSIVTPRTELCKGSSEGGISVL